MKIIIFVKWATWKRKSYLMDEINNHIFMNVCCV